MTGASDTRKLVFTRKGLLEAFRVRLRLTDASCFNQVDAVIERRP